MGRGTFHHPSLPRLMIYVVCIPQQWVWDPQAVFACLDILLKPGAEFVAGGKGRWPRWCWKGLILSCWCQSELWSGILEMHPWKVAFLFIQWVPWVEHWPVWRRAVRVWCCDSCVSISHHSHSCSAMKIPAEKQQEFYQLSCCGYTWIGKKNAESLKLNLQCSLLLSCPLLSLFVHSSNS